jgi:hypothetical protein
VHRLGGSVLAEQHAFGLRRVDDDADDDLAMRSQFGRMGAGCTALGHKGLCGLGAHVADVHMVAGATQ